MPVATRNTHGGTRVVNGKTSIFTEKGWTNFPPAAVTLITMATDHGWTVESNGLPIRTNSDGDVIVAVILSRPEQIISSALAVPAITIRAPWICQHTVFRIDRPMFRDDHGWHDLSSLREVQALIYNNRVF